MDAGTALRSSTGLAALAGLVIVFRPPGGIMPGTALLFSGTLLVVMPLALHLARLPESDSSYAFQTARFLQPFAALIAAASFLISPGVLAGTLAIAWLPVTGLLAIDAIARLRRGPAPVEERIVDLGTLYLPLGAFFLWAGRMGLSPFGTSEPELSLLALQLHGVGFAGCVLAGMAGRRLHRVHQATGTLFTVSAAAVCVGPVFTAAAALLDPGFAIGGYALLLAGAGGLTLLTVTRLLPHLDSLPARVLLAFSTLAAPAGMLAGLLHTLDGATGLIYFPVETHLVLQGWLTLGFFVTCGLLGWSLAGLRTARWVGRSG